MRENIKPGIIVKAIYDAYETNSRLVCESLLADDFTFTSPNDDDHIGKREYFEKCWPLSEEEPVFGIESMMEEGHNVFVVYNCITKTGRQFRNAEIFTLENNLVKTVEVFFGFKQSKT